MSDIEAFILTGGASSRMGVDKSGLRLGELTFVERIAGALSEVAARISVVSSKPGAMATGLPVVADVYEGRGALGGLHAALVATRARWAAVVSCDLPFVTGELFRRLAAQRREGAGAVAPLQEDGRPQPLCALYERAACLTVAEEMLREGELRPRLLLRRVQAHWVAFADLADLAGASLFFTNVNTPADYEQAQRAWELSSSGESEL